MTPKCLSQELESDNLRRLGGIFTGLAIDPTKLDQIVGVVKAYVSGVQSQMRLEK